MSGLTESELQLATRNAMSELDLSAPAWDAILAEAEAAVRAEPPRVRFARRQGRIRRLAIASVVCAATLLAATVLPGRLLQHDRVGASPAAAAVLELAASKAASAPPPVPARYAYSKVRSVLPIISNDEPQWTALVDRQTETWTAADGAGLSRETTLAVRFPSETDQARAERANATLPQAGTTRTAEFAPGPDLVEVAALPTEPGPLREKLVEEVHGKDVPLESALLVRVADLLQSPAATPALRAALYRVLAHTDGVRSLGETTDPEGRAGAAITAPVGYLDKATIEQILILDPNSGNVLATETRLLSPTDWTAATPPASISSTVYLDSGTASRPGAKPVP